MILNAITLFDDKERLRNLFKQCNEQDISLHVWEGITGVSRFSIKENISKAHKQVIQYAQDNSVDKICVAEDDIKFTCGKSYKYFIDNIPVDDFDIYFGGLSGGMIDEKNEVHNFSGMFLYIVHERFYDVFLSADETKNIDRWLGHIYYKQAVIKPVYKVCNPIAAITSDGHSAHFNQEMDYSKYWKPYKLYNGE